MTTIRGCAALVCAFIAVGGFAGDAQRLPLAIGELEHATWTIRDGAPASVQALAQSMDRMLWIGTTKGLYQFDGVKFEPLEEPAASGPACPLAPRRSPSLAAVMVEQLVGRSDKRSPPVSPIGGNP